jgi:hypothetical protein
MPSKEFLIDALREAQIEEDLYSECVDTFILNAKFLGMLRTIAGAGASRHSRACARGMWRSTGVGPDFFLEYVVAPALKEFNLRVIRADQIV